MNIGVIYFKQLYIIGWRTDIDSIMNGNIFILKCINDIQNPGSESMHIRNRNVDYEEVRICHWTIGLIKIDKLNLITPIFTVS